MKSIRYLFLSICLSFVSLTKGQVIPSLMPGCQKCCYAVDQDHCCEADGFNGLECNAVVKVQVTGYGCIAPQLIRVYSDDFQGTQIDNTFWHKDNMPVHGLGTNNLPEFKTHKEWFNPDNVIVSDGTLKLKAIYSPLTNHQFSFWDNTGQFVTTTDNFDFQCGGVRSRFHFASPYGTKIRSRIRVDQAVRARYSFWTFGESMVVPGRYAEIDVFEIYPAMCIDNRFIQKQMMNTLSYLNNGNDYYKRWALKQTNNNDEIFGCQNSEIPASTTTDFNIYEVYYDRYGIRWKTGVDFNQMATMRYDPFFFSSTGAQLSCVNLDGTFDMIDASITRIPTGIKQDLRFTFYVQFDKDNQGSGDYFTPKYQTMDWVEVFQEVPCLGDVVYNDVDDVAMIDDLYNVRLIHNGEMNNVEVLAISSQWGPIGRALKVIITGELTLNAGTTFDSECYIDLEYRDQDVYCTGTPWLMIKEDDSEGTWEGGASDPLTFPEEVVIDSAVRYLSPTLQQKEEDLAKLYPNPTGGSLTVDIPMHYNATTFRVVDNLGKEIFQGTISAGEYRIELNLAALAPGKYSLSFLNAQENLLETLTFIKD